MDAACNQIHRDYRAMMDMWLAEEALDISVSTHLVLERIEELPLYLSESLKEEYPAESATTSGARRK